MSSAGLYAEIYAELASEKSLFPSLPESTLRLRQVLADPNCNIKSAAKLIATNPGLSAFIMKTAGSVRFLTRRPPKDIETAVKRIGLHGCSQLATTFAVRSLFKATTPELKHLMQQAYRNATRVSVISHYLALQIRGFRPNKAMLGGLLQDIALPLVLKALSNRPQMINDVQQRNQAIAKLCPLVGVQILKQWNFDKELVEVVRSRQQWLRDEQRKPDLADLVLIARYHALIGTPEFQSCPPLSELPAFRKLPLGKLTPEKSLEMLAEAQNELEELARILT